jgi:hypothetical protein
VDGRKIILEQITTQDQLADILMKPLDRVKFEHLRDRIGVVNIKDELQD